MTFKRAITRISELVADVLTVGADAPGNRLEFTSTGTGVTAEGVLASYSGLAGESPAIFRGTVQTDGAGDVPVLDLQSGTVPTHPYGATLQLHPTTTSGAGGGGTATFFADQVSVAGLLDAGTVHAGVKVQAGAFVDDLTGVTITTPVGTVIMFAGPTTPAAYITCDGRALDRTAWSALFAVIGTTYGPGDGSTTFNVPNFTHRSPRGEAPGATGGADSATLAAGNLPPHAHAVPAHVHTTPARYTVNNTATGSAVRVADINGMDGTGGTAGTFDTGSGGAGNTDNGPGASTPVPTTTPYLGVRFLIKAL